MPNLLNIISNEATPKQGLVYLVNHKIPCKNHQHKVKPQGLRRR